MNSSPKRVVKRPQYNIVVAMLRELLSLKKDGDCFVPFHADDIQKQIDSLKEYSGK